MSKGSSAFASALVELGSKVKAGTQSRNCEPPLITYTVGDFKPKLVIERLLSPEPSYFAKKDILFAALCAWVVTNNRPQLVEDTMVLAGMSRFAQLERRLRARFPNNPIIADFFAGAEPGVEFYADFYHPLGGLGRVLRTRSPSAMKRSLVKASTDIEFTVEMMRVCHHHAVHLQGRRLFRRSSVIAGGAAVSKLVEVARDTPGVVSESMRNRKSARTVNEENCVKKYQKFMSAAALIYSA